MLSKNTVKFIKSLHQKKFRRLEESFFVEGSKNVTELLASDFDVTHILYTREFAAQSASLLDHTNAMKYEVNEELLANIGSFQSNRAALAVAKCKKNETVKPQKGDLVLALDDVRDPGNLGTIIRIADWYGIRKVLMSYQSADFYNPKVLNASMGSFVRVHFEYVDLVARLTNLPIPVYGTFLDGENIHGLTLRPEGVILMGNEANGISDAVRGLVDKRLRIPSFGAAESLNVAIATAVVCDNFRRFDGLPR